MAEAGVFKTKVYDDIGRLIRGIGSSKVGTTFAS
jgi:hypothetical protein